MVRVVVFLSRPLIAPVWMGVKVGSEKECEAQGRENEHRSHRLYVISQSYNAVI
jgi:hypothetical protein